MINIGGHVSAAGGVSKALERAHEIGFQSVQIHPGSPQTWKGLSIPDEEITQFKKLRSEYQISPVFFHNIYLINFASDEPRIWQGGISSTKKYLEYASKMDVQGVITHLGSGKGKPLEEVFPQLIEALKEVLKECPNNTKFIIENTAGAGSTIGRTIEEIGEIIKAVPQEYHNRLGVCIDTCHAFASGISYQTKEEADNLVAKIESNFGLQMLSCIHLNDSKYDFNTNKDRHENIGEGFISREAFSNLFHHPKLQNIPFILEVPGIEGTGPDKINLQRVIDIAK